MKIKPLFLTFEGIDGAGKSSHIAWFAEALRSRGVKVLATREPGGTPLGELWRDQLLHEKLSPETQTLLMFAARSEHLAQVIRPALERGEWVLCDRFTDATFAYQGGGYGISREIIETLAGWLHGDCEPDKTVLFDVSPSVSQTRISRDTRREDRQPDRFESEPEAFQRRVREAYLDRARRDPRRVAVIDASLSFAQVREELEGVLDELIPL
jgi:dTMP kinase